MSNAEPVLARTMQQWRNGVPDIIAEGSKAQVLFALRDGKHDVLALSAALEAERELRLKAEALLREIVACTHKPNPTDPSRIDVPPGQHRRFQAAIASARTALAEVSDGQ